MSRNIDKKSMELTDAELERLIGRIEKESMLKAPKDLKENILAESRKLGSKVEQQSQKLSVKMQLLLYSLKISTAVVGAIFLLGVIPTDSSRINHSVTKTLNEKSSAVSSALNNFSSSLINWR